MFVLTEHDEYLLRQILSQDINRAISDAAIDIGFSATEETQDYPKEFYEIAHQELEKILEITQNKINSKEVIK